MRIKFFCYIFAKAMAIVTLTTDFGNQDFYAGLLKGKLLTVDPSINIIDITHQINPFDIPSAAFQVRTILHAFPQNTIHVVLVNAFEQNATIAAINFYNQWIILPDNRMASMIMQMNIQEGLTLNEELIKDIPNYFGRIAKLVEIISLQQYDKLIPISLKPAQWFYPYTNQNSMKGLIIHIDRFGNCISNIHKDDFYRELKGRKFELCFRKIRINKIHNQYYEVDKGDALAYFGLSGFLELAIREANASSLLGVKVFDQFTIDFFND